MTDLILIVGLFGVYVELLIAIGAVRWAYQVEKEYGDA